MEKIKNKYLELKKLDDRIQKLHKMVEKTTKKRDEEKEYCSHDLVVVYKKVDNVREGKISYARCLICNEDISFTKDYHLYDYQEGMQFESVSPNSIMDFTDIITEKARENWSLGSNLFADRARNKFVELMHNGIEMSLNEVKKAIAIDAICYEKEFYGNKNTSIPEYTNEEISIALRSDDNTEIVNAVCEECVDLCSEGVKRKIK